MSSLTKALEDRKLLELRGMVRPSEDLAFNAIHRDVDFTTAMTDELHHEIQNLAHWLGLAPGWSGTEMP